MGWFCPLGSTMPSPTVTRDMPPLALRAKYAMLCKLSVPSFSTSPCDCGGRRGILTPAWWSDTSTQFGFLKTWRVDHTGSYLDNQQVGDVNIADLALDPYRYISVRIGVPADAENVGGLNLFGDKFGDYPQALQLRVGYHFRAG